MLCAWLVVLRPRLGKLKKQAAALDSLANHYLFEGDRDSYEDILRRLHETREAICEREGMVGG